MSAAYAEPAGDAGRRRDAPVRAEFDIRNDSAETWRAAEGFGVGYHMFDAETGTLIVDGARRASGARYRARARRARVRSDSSCPPEDGRYQVLISPMREDVCWYYEQGWPFLRGGSRRQDGRRPRWSACAWPRAAPCGASARCAPWAARSSIPVLTIWRNRGLIRVMVRRDILGRYRGSFGGVVLDRHQPAAADADLLLRVRRGAARRASSSDPSRSGFALYFLAGMLPWLAFSEAAGPRAHA